jgi:hypothetical protein
VGGLQNTVTNLGASLGTALAGAVLISSLTASFLSGIENNPAVPAQVKSEASTKLAAGIPFVSDAQLQTELDKAGVPHDTATAIVDENSKARLDALRAALAALALVGTLGWISRRIPTEQPGTSSADQTV